MCLVLFDIDGTLLHTHGAGRRAMRRALITVYGTAGPIAHYNMAGKTDRLIIHDLLSVEGVPLQEIAARFDAYTRVYAQALEEELQRTPPQVLPGVPELIERLHRRPDVVLGLLTGNLAVGARLKLRYAGLDPDTFTLGAYGSDAMQREALPPLALHRARQQLGQTFNGHAVVIIGDTPLDIQCGRPIGAKSVAVATGPYSVQELQTFRPDVVLPNFSDVETAVRAILDGTGSPRVEAFRKGTDNR